MSEQKNTRVIKRYRNRKLYDTRDSCYITLEDIADMVRQGEDISVIDNNTRENLTSVTLAQIILDEERKKKEALPLSTLIQLIRSGGETIKDLVQKSIGGGVREIQNVREEIQQNLERWIKQGSIGYDEGNKVLSNIKSFFEAIVRPTVEKVQNIPTVHSEVKILKKRLEELEKKMEGRKSRTKRKTS